MGADLDFAGVHASQAAAAFCESPSRYILEVAPENLSRIESILKDVPRLRIGTLSETGRLRWTGASVDEAVDDLARAWLAPLNW
jgi:phosphoribosylformylglycinamidine synthase subunit PurSL